MRATLSFFAVLLLALAGYAYVHDPSGCEKVLNDACSVVGSASPISPQSDAASPISALTQGKLISADGSPFSFPANAPVASIRYYAIYYSAQWCPPCHAFTPVLVQWYKKFKPSHPNFELIFVSEDHNEAAMLDYMKEMAMPWPAVRFGDLKHDGNGTFKGSGIEKFAGSGIPDLVLVDADGKVLSDSFASTGSYLGPRHVLDDIEKLLVASASAPSEQPAAAAPAPASASAVPNPPPPPSKAWAPPDVMPSQPNWTWTTSDGTTYQNVVVTKIEAETVTITHSMGAAHVSISTLPPDIQKKLGYDPVAAAAARAESKRELAHPYYTMASLAEAQGVAHQMHWPLAWVVSGPTLLSAANSEADSWAGLTQMSMDHLKSQSIVIFVDGYTELGNLPSIIRDQLFHLDDGVLPNGHHFIPPKIVFSDADVTKALGRVPYTQMKASGALAIDEVLDSIPKDSDAQSPANAQTASAPAPPASSSTPAPVPATPLAPAAPATAAVSPISAPAATPSPDAVKPWAPPDVVPSQPNWTWETLDGKTYQNVVVTRIEADTVSITHSMGAAHIPISLLPPDIQKQLNYDPHAASHGN